VLDEGKTAENHPNLEPRDRRTPTTDDDEQQSERRRHQ